MFWYMPLLPPSKNPSVFEMTNFKVDAAVPEKAENEKTSLRADTNCDATDENDTPHVVYSSDASYHPLASLYIAFCPAFILANILIVWRDKTLMDDEKRVAVNTSLWSILGLASLFLLLLPIRFEVVSDASVNVVTFVKIKWNFKNVVAAYVQNQNMLFSEWCRPKIKFASSSRDKNVVVRRKNGAWDLLVSPKDPAAFVEAVFNVVGEGT